MYRAHCKRATSFKIRKATMLKIKHKNESDVSIYFYIIFKD